MLKKKLILLLIGISVAGIATSNTTISIASPPVKSPQMLHFPEILGDNDLNKLSRGIIYQLYYLRKTNHLRYIIDTQLDTLDKSLLCISGVKSKFNKISEQLDALTEKEYKLTQQFSKDAMSLSKITKHIDKSLQTLTLTNNYQNSIAISNNEERLLYEKNRLNYLLTKSKESGEQIPYFENKFEELVNLLKKASFLSTYYYNNPVPSRIEKKNEMDCLLNKEEVLLSKVKALIFEINTILSEAELFVSLTNSKLSDLTNEVFLTTLNEVDDTKDDTLENIIPPSNVSNQLYSNINIIQSADVSSRQSQITLEMSPDTNTELKLSDSIISSPLIRYDVLFHQLGDDVSSEYFKFASADALRHRINFQLVSLKQYGMSTLEFQGKFYKISKDLNSLRSKETTLLNPFIKDINRLHHLPDIPDNKGNISYKYKNIETWVKDVGYQLPKILENGKDISVLRNKFLDLSIELDFLITTISAESIAHSVITTLSEPKPNILLDIYCNTIDNPNQLKEDAKKCKHRINNLLDELEILLNLINNKRAQDLGIPLESPTSPLFQAVQPGLSSSPNLSKKITASNNKLHETEEIMTVNSISQVNAIESDDSQSSSPQTPPPFDSIYPAILPTGTWASIPKIASLESKTSLKKRVRFSEDVEFKILEYHEEYEVENTNPEKSISQVNIIQYENPDSSNSSVSPVTQSASSKNTTSEKSMSQVNVMQSENPSSSVVPVIQSSFSNKANNLFNRFLALFEKSPKVNRRVTKNFIFKANNMKIENTNSPVDSLEKPIINPTKPQTDPSKTKSAPKIENFNLTSEENIKKYELNEKNNTTKVNNSNHDSNDLNVEPSNPPIENKVTNEVSSNVIIQEKSIEKQIILPETESSIIKDESFDNKDESFDNKEKTDGSENMVISN